MTYAAALQALADPTRRAIVEKLRHGPKSVGQLAQGFRITRPAVSQHLRVLCCAGLLDVVPVGARRVYRLRPEGFAQLRVYLEDLWRDALRPLDTPVLPAPSPEE